MHAQASTHAQSHQYCKTASIYIYIYIYSSPEVTLTPTNDAAIIINNHGGFTSTAPNDMELPVANSKNFGIAAESTAFAYS